MFILPSFKSKLIEFNGVYFRSWFPFLGLIFNLICPIPTIIARRRTDSVGGISSACMESAIFITMGIVVSSFAYPIVLARAGLVCILNCYFVSFDCSGIFTDKVYHLYSL